MEALDDDPFKNIHRRKDVALLLCKMIKLYTSATYGSPASLKITLNLGDLRAELQATWASTISKIWGRVDFELRP